MPKKKVTRSDGKLSRQSILEATLLIILDTGIRSVKYKTVAEAAGVTQSAIAYYFSSIPVLIEQSFRYYFEKYTEEMTHIRELGIHILAEISGMDLDSMKARKIFLTRYAEKLMMLLGSDYPDLRLYLLLDRIFRNETLFNKPLYKILKVQDQKDIDAITHLFSSLSTKQPEVEATQFMALLWYLAEHLLQENYNKTEQAEAKKLIENMLQKILLDEHQSV